MALSEIITFAFIPESLNKACTNPRPSSTGCFCPTFQFTIMLFQATKEITNFSILKRGGGEQASSTRKENNMRITYNHKTPIKYFHKQIQLQISNSKKTTSWQIGEVRIIMKVDFNTLSFLLM